MKTRQQIIDETIQKNPSDFEGQPARHSYIAFSRDELLAVLDPPKNDRAQRLLNGVNNSGVGSNLFVIREHLLEAMGELDGDA